MNNVALVLSQAKALSEQEQQELLTQLEEYLVLGIQVVPSNHNRFLLYVLCYFIPQPYWLYNVISMNSSMDSMWKMRFSFSYTVI